MDVIVIVGALVYPDPAFVIVMAVILPVPIVAVAVAPLPPPPLILICTFNAVYPDPPTKAVVLVTPDVIEIVGVEV